MKFSQYINLSESMKDLAHVIGTEKAKKLTSKKPMATIGKMHDKVFGKDNHHIEIPLKNEIPESVKDHIESQGDSLHPDGDKVTLDSGRHAPIPKYLAKSNAPKHVQDDYQNYARNKTEGKSDTKLVISRKPAEVASASCGTSWKSCADPRQKDGPAWKAMPHEVKQGTLIAMQVKHDAQKNEHGEYDSKDVIGRVLIKRHDSDKHAVFASEDKSYGKFGANATNAIKEFTDKHYPMKDAVYQKHKDVYDDDANSYKVNKKLPKDEFDRIVNSNPTDMKGEQAKILLLRHSPHVNDEMAAKLMTDKHHPVNANQTMKNPHLSSEFLHKTIDDAVSKNDDVTLSHISENPSLKPDHLKKIINSNSLWAQMTALQHPNANGDVVSTAINKPGFRHKEQAIRHPRLPSAEMDKIVDGKVSEHKELLSQNQSLRPKHIEKMLNDDDRQVRWHAIGNKNATPDNINTALKYKNHGALAIRAIDHKNATPDNIDKVLHSDYGDDTREVRMHAIQRANASPENLHTALGIHGDNGYTAMYALQHPNITSDHIETALKHPNPAVKKFALEHQKSTKEQAERFSNDENENVKGAARKRTRLLAFHNSVKMTAMNRTTKE